MTPKEMQRRGFPDEEIVRARKRSGVAWRLARQKVGYGHHFLLRTPQVAHAARHVRDEDDHDGNRRHWITACERWVSHPSEPLNLGNLERNLECKTYVASFVTSKEEYCTTCAEKFPLVQKGTPDLPRIYTDTLESYRHHYSGPVVFNDGAMSTRALASGKDAFSDHSIGLSSREAVLHNENTSPAIIRSRGSLELVWEPGSTFTNEEVEALGKEFAALVAKYR